MSLSVIMGAYNAEKTISRAVDSIIMQTYTDWVFIICDDGSCDKTLSILEEYKRRFPLKFIILKNGENKGLTYTLNHCLKYAESEYVARMDADDISLPDRFSKEVQFLDHHPEYAFVSCAIERFDEDGVWNQTHVSDNSPTKECFYKSSGFVHPTVMVRKSAYTLVNGYREAWYTNRCEDYDLWMRMYSEGLKGYIIDEILFQYYEGKDSFPKRRFRYRIGEAVMRAKGYFSLRMYPKGIIYVFKPLVAGILPKTVVMFLHNR